MESSFERVVSALVAVLSAASTEVEAAVINGLEQVDPEVADEIKRSMFEFDDIVILDDRSIQKVLREIEMPELSLAMRLAEPDTFSAITRNMSENAIAELRAEIGNANGAEIDAVIEAQEQIVDIVHKLEEAGEIVVARAGEQR